MFYCLVVGSRTFTDYSLMCEKLDKLLSRYNSLCVPICIVSGGARGADALAERYAKEHNYQLEVFHADWNKYGKSAGIRRNKQMAEVADALVAFWDGKSRGTKNMIEQMRRLKKPVKIVYYNQ